MFMRRVQIELEILLPKARELASEEITFFDDVMKYLEAPCTIVIVAVVFVWCLQR
jgi:hypothetical protein